jgi:hypothetical protein
VCPEQIRVRVNHATNRKISVLSMLAIAMACVKPAKTATTALPIVSPVLRPAAGMASVNLPQEKIAYPAPQIVAANKMVQEKIVSVAVMAMGAIRFPAATTDAQPMDLPAVRNPPPGSAAAISYARALKQAAVAASIAVCLQPVSSRESVAQTEKMMIAMAQSIAMIQIAARILYARHHHPRHATTMVCVKPVKIVTTAETIVQAGPVANLPSAIVVATESDRQRKGTAPSAIITTERFNAETRRCREF